MSVQKPIIGWTDNCAWRVKVKLDSQLLSGDTREEYPWEFPEFEQYKNPDFVFDYNGTPVIYAFWTAGHKENFQNHFS